LHKFALIIYLNIDGFQNAARGDCNFRVRRLAFPRAAFGISACGVWNPRVRRFEEASPALYIKREAFVVFRS